MTTVLEVYVTEDCQGCIEARAIAEEMSTQFPVLDVRLIPIDQADVEAPEDVFAVPTFVLQGKVVSLGNPDRDELCRKIDATIQTDSQHAPS